MGAIYACVGVRGVWVVSVHLVFFFFFFSVNLKCHKQQPGFKSLCSFLASPWSVFIL